MPTEHYTPNFYNEIRDGSARSAEVIVPLVSNLLHPASVVDVGCGDGTWLSIFRKLGTQEIVGVDGDYVRPDLLQIPPENFCPADLAKPFTLDRTFDLAVSLEVAEHLPAGAASSFVASLTRLAPVVLFSAAIPFQGGNHHVNEQWPDSWAALFRQHNYVPVDCIRKHVWQNSAVEWWYAQNALLFVQPGLFETNPALYAEFRNTNACQLAVVHPRNYLDALVAIDPCPWGVKTSVRLFLLCLSNFLKRRFAGNASAQNPPNFNLALENSSYRGISRRPSQN